MFAVNLEQLTGEMTTLGWVVIGIYVVFISLLGSVLTIYDKRQARRYSQKRVSESALMLIGLFGGALAMYITMKKIRHKTKYRRFMWGLPIIIIVEALILAIAVYPKELVTDYKYAYDIAVMLGTMLP